MMSVDVYCMMEKWTTMMYIVAADHTVVDCQQRERQQSATSLSRLTVSRIVVDCTQHNQDIYVSYACASMTSQPLRPTLSVWLFFITILRRK